LRISLRLWYFGIQLPRGSGDNPTESSCTRGMIRCGLGVRGNQRYLFSAQKDLNLSGGWLICAGKNSRRFGGSAGIVEGGIGGQGIRSFVDCATRAKLVKDELGGKN
jgi:hypothetical protein